MFAARLYDTTVDHIDSIKPSCYQGHHSNEDESKKFQTSAYGSRGGVNAKTGFRPRSKLTENRFVKMVSIIYLFDINTKEVTEFIFRL